MTRTIVLVCFMVAFAAGLTVGLESQKRAAVAPSPGANRPSHRGGGGWLAAELGLDAQQQEDLDKIWSETASRGGRERDDRRRQMYRERDDAIAALIRPEDRARYEEIRNKHSEQMDVLDREWRASFENAVEKTKGILTPEQRVKYEKLMQRHQEERGSRDRRRGGDRGRERPSRESTTSPAT